MRRPPPSKARRRPAPPPLRRDGYLSPQRGARLLHSSQCMPRLRRGIRAPPLAALAARPEGPSVSIASEASSSHNKIKPSPAKPGEAARPEGPSVSIIHSSEACQRAEGERSRQPRPKVWVHPGLCSRPGSTTSAEGASEPTQTEGLGPIIQTCVVGLGPISWRSQLMYLSTYEHRSLLRCESSEPA